MFQNRTRRERHARRGPRARSRGDGDRPVPRVLALERLLHHAAEGVCVVNAQGRIALWNRSAEKILGYTSRAVIGRLCCEVFAGGDGSAGWLCYNGCHAMTVMAPSAPRQQFDVTMRTRPGRPIRLAVSALVVRGTRSKRSAVLHLFRDVTASREVGPPARRRTGRLPAPDDDRTSPGAALTRREIEVLRLMSGGANTRAIAALLRVSAATVRNHVQHLFGKLGVHSRLEAVAHAARHGLLLRPIHPPGPARWMASDQE